MFNCPWFTDHSLFDTAKDVVVGRGVILIQTFGAISAYFVGQTEHITDVSFELDSGSCGMNHAVLRSTSGCGYVIGSNISGQCGFPESVDFCPNFVNIGSDVELVAGGASFSIVLFKDGRLCGSGLNKDGQLGIETHEMILNWAQIPNVPKNIVHISCGYAHSCLVSNGVVFASGLNSHGQLNFLGKDIRTDKFTPVSFPFSIESVACGVWTTAFVTHEGEVYIAGKAPMYQEGPREIKEFIKDYKLAEERANKATILSSMTKLETQAKIFEIQLGSSTGIALCQDRVTVLIVDLTTLQVDKTIVHTSVVKRISVGGNSWAFI